MRGVCSRLCSSRERYEWLLAPRAAKKYFHDMSAVEVIEEFKKLPAEEQANRFIALRAALEREMIALKARLAEIERVLNPEEPQRAEVSEDFKKIADHVFTKNAELFRKLAQ